MKGQELEIEQEDTVTKKTVDVEALIRNKNPRLLKFLPKFLLNYVKRIIHQEEMNVFLYEHRNDNGFEFSSGVVKYFNVNVIIKGIDNVPKTGGVVFAGNHPLGGFDAMVILDSISHVRTDVKFIVNDILLNLKNLKPLFVGVNKHGKNSVQMLEEIDSTYSSEQAVFIYPAGLVSRKNDAGKIEDLEWKKSFITKSKKHKRQVIPLYVSGQNSNRFYNLSRWRTKLGIKANIEMFFLVDEMFKQRDKTITVIFGKPIPYETFDNSKSDLQWAHQVKKMVYQLAETIH
jgi:putative hemolysin